ncbi:MAG: PilZ domain-containing protein [Myxococcota bacterium]
MASPPLVPVTLRFDRTEAEIRDLDARLIDLGPNEATVELVNPPAHVRVGAGVVMLPSGQRNLELVGLIRSTEGSRVCIELSRAGHREDRWSPRERGELAFRYRAPRPGEDPEAWAESGLAPAAEWTVPDPRVDLSLSGLAFLAPRPGPEGTLLIELEVPEGPAPRLAAEVVRTDPTRRPDVVRVSTRFTKVPPATGHQLAERILAWQDAALEALGAGGSTLDLPQVDASVAEPGE